MKYRTLAALAASPLVLGVAQPAVAASPKFGDPVKVSDTLTIDPIVDARLRYESVDQPVTEAEAVTLRLRAGAEARFQSLSFLVEGEGTLAIGQDYNAFPFAVASSQRRPAFSVVPDPMNVELNRAQLQYKTKSGAVTLGRQRINLDDQRWVGSVGWRQNEQTFDAVRAEAKVGPVLFDGTYSWSQRTIFGYDAGPRQAYDGKFFFAGAGVPAGPVHLKAFAYLIDYDEPFFVTNSSKTFGVRAATSLPLAAKVKLNLAASYARQSDYGSQPFDYAADYILGEAGVSFGSLTATAGYELLGSDGSVPGGRAVQTPMATLHKFNGWADLFLTTPGAGLQDIYGGIAYKFDGVKMLPGLNAALWYHRYDSDLGDVNYGEEWNASVGFKLGPVGVLGKYANYQADGFGVDTEKFWLQAEYGF